jgi:hypothetical protein
MQNVRPIKSSLVPKRGHRRCKITHFISISPPETEKNNKLFGILQGNAYLCNVKGEAR